MTRFHATFAIKMALGVWLIPLGWLIPSRLGAGTNPARCAGTRRAGERLSSRTLFNPAPRRCRRPTPRSNARPRTWPRRR